MSNHVENGTSNGANTNKVGAKESPDLKSKDAINPIRKKIFKNALEGIGMTPIIKLNKIPQSEGIVCDMYVKCEFENTGGSVKDRIARHMVEEAEKQGRLVPGKSVIIEPTSGNTGIGLALVSAIKGYRCIIVLPEKMSDEKVNTLRALGAEIIRTPTEAPSESPESNLGVAKRLVNEIPNAVMLDQYSNPNNPDAHYHTTAEEILWSFDDQIDMVVMGAGTGGTISGTGKKIKERCPDCLIIGVDPYGSILAVPPNLNPSDVTYYEVEGLGYDFIPSVLDRGVVDKWYKSDDTHSLELARRLVREEGILGGGSSGAALSGALKAAKSLKQGQKCIVVLPDGIRNYMSKFISDPWMEVRKFKPLIENKSVWWWHLPVPKELIKPTDSISKDSTVQQAFDVLVDSKAPLLNVVDGNGSLVGIFTADNTRYRLTNLSGNMHDPIDKFILKKYYKVEHDSRLTLGFVSRNLDIAPFVVVVETESKTVTRPIGVITSTDLLQHVHKDKKNGN